MAALSSLIWLLFVLVAFIIPGYRQKRIEALRVGLIRRLEQMRGRARPGGGADCQGNPEAPG